MTKPDTMFDFLKPHIKPLQAPHPPIGVAGLSKGSDTLKLAGERGYIPMSLNLNPAYVSSHWESVEAGAAKTGRKPNRQDWRMVREVFVADTDEEAWKLSVGDMMRMMSEYRPRLTILRRRRLRNHPRPDALRAVEPQFFAAKLRGDWRRDSRRRKLRAGNHASRCRAGTTVVYGATAPRPR